MLSSIFMMLTLAWLTVSLPFVNGAQQTASQMEATAAGLPADSNDDDNDNPFANTTEEKTSNSSISLSEEYLHDSHSAEQYFAVPSIEYKVVHASTYIAFHGELISPPPDAC